MKKLITILLAGVFAAGSVLAMDDIIELSGEIKTGVFVEQRENNGVSSERNAIYNNDGDSGDLGSRVRFGVNMHTKGIGVRTQFSQKNFSRRKDINDISVALIATDFAYMYGNLFKSQFKISGGLLGESPWGTNGPNSELDEELEIDGGNPVTGIRFEWKPTFSPHIRGLNIGFVINRANEAVPDAKESFGDLFLESIVGIAWEHQYFAFTFAYRFDRGLDSPAATTDGDKFLYRVEERLLWRLVPGMSISANGFGLGVNAKGNRDRAGTRGFIQHWLYISYNPEYFSSGLKVGYRDGFELITKQLEFKPYFYYNIIPNHLEAGVMGGMELGYDGGRCFEETPVNYWFVEPQVKVIINPNFYFALVYQYRSGAYETERMSKDQVTNWVNLRLSFSF